MRLASAVRMAFYPLPVPEAVRLRRFLRFPASGCAAIDPCVGDGVAFATLTENASVLRYGIELDSYRAAQARERVENVVQGNALETHCPVESLSLLYENCPYGAELGQDRSQRMEQIFLNHTYRWLKPAGVLATVIPGERLRECSGILAAQFREARVYRLSEPVCVRYKQVVVPESGPVQLIYRGLPLDEVEDLLPSSPAYRQAGRLLFPEPTGISGRPLISLKSGAIGLLAVGGGLDGIFGSGNDRHISAWMLQKQIDRFEETDEKGTLTIHERERFAHELALVLVTGETAILK